MPQLNFRSGLQSPQYQSIQNLVSSGRTLNETDARNLGYATNTSNWQQFVGQSSSNYSIGNLSKYLPNATPNISSNNLSSDTLQDLGQSSFPSFFNNIVTTGMTQTELGLQNYISQRENIRTSEEKKAQKKYDEALAGLEGAYKQPSGADLLKGYMAEYDIEGKIKQLSEFQNQLVTLQSAYQTSVNDIGNKPINAAIIRGQQYLKEQEYAGKASVIQAQSAIAQEQFNMAKDIVSTYYDVAMADRANTINRYKTLMELAKDELITLDAEEKENINMFIGNLQAMDARQREEKDRVAELMLDPVAQVAFQNTPGLDLNMSYSDMIEKLLPAMTIENIARYNLKNRKSGSSSTSTLQSTTSLQDDITDQAIDMVSAEQALGREFSASEYWNYVKQFAEINGLEVSIADAQLRNAMREVKYKHNIPQGGYKQTLEDKIKSLQGGTGGYTAVGKETEKAMGVRRQKEVNERRKETFKRQLEKYGLGTFVR